MYGTIGLYCLFFGGTPAGWYYFGFYRCNYFYGIYISWSIGIGLFYVPPIALLILNYEFQIFLFYSFSFTHFIGNYLFLADDTTDILSL